MSSSTSSSSQIVYVNALAILVSGTLLSLSLSLSVSSWSRALLDPFGHHKTNAYGVSFWVYICTVYIYRRSLERGILDPPPHILCRQLYSLCICTRRALYIYTVVAGLLSLYIIDAIFMCVYIKVSVLTLKMSWRDVSRYYTAWIFPVKTVQSSYYTMKHFSSSESRADGRRHFVSAKQKTKG